MLPLLLLSLGCSSPSVDVSLRMPQDATIVVNHKTSSTTRTPLGPENLEIKTTRQMAVLQGGRLGVDELHWREEFTRYSIHWETRDYLVDWKMGGEEEIPGMVSRLGPHSPREVWITRRGRST